MCWSDYAQTTSEHLTISILSCICSEGDVSDAVKSLLTSLLVRDPAQRLTANQVLDNVASIVTSW